VWQEHGEHLERELNEANKTNRLQYELITTAEKRGVDKSKEELNRLNDRIKQLEAKVDELHDLEKWLEGR
jgi:archaellum component FlaC